MDAYVDLFLRQLVGYGRYLWGEITQPRADSYFYWLVLVSLVVYGLELTIPWRRGQARLRRGFFLDAWYMFFNFFGFPLLGFAAVSAVAEALFRDASLGLGISDFGVLSVANWPVWAQLLVLFVLRDFVQWNIHRLLHRVDGLWEFHKVHHSVVEMGFAAHLRYHWMESVVYRTLEYIPLALIGFGIQEFFVVHIVALCIGHCNHANIRLPLGPLKYIFNSPGMHIWHHAIDIPVRYGVNFGLSLSLWDYLFRTAYVPKDGASEPLGFEDIESYPEGFWGQMAEPFVSLRRGTKS